MSLTRNKIKKSIEDETSERRMSLDSCISNDMKVLAYQYMNRASSRKISIVIYLSFFIITDKWNWESEKARIGKWNNMVWRMVTILWSDIKAYLVMMVRCIFHVLHYTERYGHKDCGFQTKQGSVISHKLACLCKIWRNCDVLKTKVSRNL